MKILCLTLLVLLLLTACGRSNRPEVNVEIIAEEPAQPTPSLQPPPVYIPTPEPLPPPPAQAIQLTPAELIQLTNQRRHDLPRPTREQLYELTQDRVPWTFDMSEIWGNPRATRVSTQEAIEDTKTLFDLMR